MNDILDLAYQLLTSPHAAMQRVTKGGEMKNAFILWLFTVLLISMSSIISGPGIIVAFIFCAMGMGLAVFIHSAVTAFCAGLLGGDGTAKGIAAGFFAASFPYAFSVFGALLAVVTGGLAGILGPVLGFWSFALDVIAIEENYRLPLGRALLVALIPLILFAVIFLVLLLLGVAAAISGLADLAGGIPADAVLEML